MSPLGDVSGTRWASVICDDNIGYQVGTKGAGERSCTLTSRLHHGSDLPHRAELQGCAFPVVKDHPFDPCMTIIRRNEVNGASINNLKREFMPSNQSILVDEQWFQVAHVLTVTTAEAIGPGMMRLRHHWAIAMCQKSEAFGIGGMSSKCY